jgi:hypothetical protein
LPSGSQTQPVRQVDWPVPVHAARQTFWVMKPVFCAVQIAPLGQPPSVWHCSVHNPPGNPLENMPWPAGMQKVPPEQSPWAMHGEPTKPPSKPTQLPMLHCVPELHALQLPPPMPQLLFEAPM